MSCYSIPRYPHLYPNSWYNYWQNEWAKKYQRTLEDHSRMIQYTLQWGVPTGPYW
jgi:hypothetical protein